MNISMHVGMFQAIHQGQNCKEYQDELRFHGMNSDQRSEAAMEDLIKEGKGMKCPTCKVIYSFDNCVNLFYEFYSTCISGNDYETNGMRLYDLLDV